MGDYIREYISYIGVYIGYVGDCVGQYRSSGHSSCDQKGPGSHTPRLPDTSPTPNKRRIEFDCIRLGTAPH